MKVTQYITTVGAEMQSNPVYPSMRLSGATDIVRGKAIGNDFLGFGVAITGSSCYNLFNMEKKERRAVLENLYGKDGLNFRVGRISVASSDYSPELYSYDDENGDVELKHFSIARDTAYIIPVLLGFVSVMLALEKDVANIIPIIKALADEFADVYIPLNEIFDEALKTQPSPKYYSADGVHPNENGARFIGEIYTNAVKALL